MSIRLSASGFLLYLSEIQRREKRYPGWFEMNPIDILRYYSAEDVKGIEVMKSLKYNLAYQSKFYDPMKINFMDPPVFIEITTKTGEGPFMKKTPGIYLYKPLVPVVAK